MPKKSIVEAILTKAAAAGSSLVSVFSGLLAALLVIYSGYILYDNIYTHTQAESGWDLLQYRPEIIDDESVPFGSSPLASLNDDYRAWITLYDTNIDYPVMQGSNDLYYASHDVYKKSSLTGAIYLASANSANFGDSYNLIYGHHMDGDAMFGPLDHYTEESYLESHRKGVLVTQDQVFDLYVFAVMLTDAYASELYSPGGDRMADVLSFVQAGLGTSTRFYDEAAAADAVRIVALSTCESAETNGRLVVFARMDQRDSEVFPPNELDQTGAGDSPEDPIGSDTPSNARTPSGAVVPSGGNTPSGAVVPSGGSTPSGGLEQITDTEIIEIEEDGEASSQEIEELDDEQTPLARLLGNFHPTGGSFGYKAWALLNLICLLITIYVLLPLMHLKAKYNRKKQMRRVNELKTVLAEADRPEKADTENGRSSRDETCYRVRKFVKRFRIGLLLEIVICVLAVIAFILTEDMRLPMVLIDRWTPLMIVLLLLCWIADVRLVRYRSGEEDQPEENRSEEGSGSKA